MGRGGVDGGEEENGEDQGEEEEGEGEEGGHWGLSEMFINESEDCDLRCLYLYTTSRPLSDGNESAAVASTQHSRRLPPLAHKRAAVACSPLQQ